MLSNARRAIVVGVSRMWSWLYVLMLSTPDDTFTAAEGLMSAPELLYGQLGALLRKPSPVGDIAQ